MNQFKKLNDCANEAATFSKKKHLEHLQTTASGHS